MNSKCKKNTNRLCYILCGHLVFRYCQAITDMVKETYEGYFGLRLKHQNKSFAPHVGCKTCVKTELGSATLKRSGRYRYMLQM